jgi:hypothetical protein
MFVDADEPQGFVQMVELITNVDPDEIPPDPDPWEERNNPG